MPRERDYAYEALAEVTGTDMTAGRGELNVALKTIRAQSDIEDSYLLADEIHERAKMYGSAMPDVMLTPTALAKHWKRVALVATKVRGTNLAAEPDLGPLPDRNKIPFWVRRWVAARFLYDRFGRPRDLRIFPEQADYSDPLAEQMPETEWMKEAAHISEKDVWSAVGR